MTMQRRKPMVTKDEAWAGFWAAIIPAIHEAEERQRKAAEEAEAEKQD